MIPAHSLRLWSWRCTALRYLAKFERKRKIRHRYLDLGLLRRGFNSEEHCLYDFKTHGYSDFLSDYERFLAISIDGRYRVLLSDKLLFERNYGSVMPVARNLAKSQRGRIVSLMAERSPGEEIDFAALLETSPDGVVIKPLNASGGHGICMVYPADEGHVLWNKERISISEAHERTIKHGAGHLSLIVAMVVQSEWSRSFHPASVNTVRFASGLTPGTGEPFLIRALLRIGVPASAPVDNFTAGGLSTRIDTETGTLSKCATYPRNGTLAWHSNHPVTGAQIEGAVMPRWKERRDKFLKMVSMFPETPYVAWDLVLTDDDIGFRVLEGNYSGDVNLHQIHGPLLADPRIRAFFAHYRIVSPKR